MRVAYGHRLQRNGTKTTENVEGLPNKIFQTAGINTVKIVRHIFSLSSIRCNVFCIDNTIEYNTIQIYIAPKVACESEALI